MLLNDLQVGRAYAFADSKEEAWASGSARKAYFLRRIESRVGLPINEGIEWMFGHPVPVKDDPEVLVATQWATSGLVGRRYRPEIEIGGGDWRPAIVGRKQLILPWEEFWERVEYLFEIGRRYQAFMEKVRWELRRLGIQKCEVLVEGALDAFEPEKVVVRMAGQAGLVLGKDVPVPDWLEVKALDVLHVQRLNKPIRRVRR